ncbi:RNA 2',3'-cyclic phosphodiesterase [Streptomyces sp. 6N223]|uniref:RNA 2',3'-cyclic phosphodiesterase n=1 Tax=Streptomyces sp. 6N223 TaxID=3457412 RepID=UPI003FD41DC1
MRLFAAVVPPEAARAELAAAVARVRALPGADRLRWTEPAEWHLALAFYGSVAEELVPALRERLARGAGRHRPGTLRLAGAGRFAHRVLWAGVEGDREILRALAGSAVAAARRCGVAMPGDRPYRPHLTLARGRPGRHRVDLAPYAAALADYAGSPWPLAAFRLVRSHLPAEGVPGARPRYETLDAWPLGDG